MYHFESCKPAHILATLLFSFKALEKLLIVELGLGPTSHLSLLFQPAAQGPAPRAAAGWSGGDVAAGYTCSGQAPQAALFLGQDVQGFPFLPKWQ